MDVVKNQMSIPTYEKPMMVVMELEVEGALLSASMTDVTTGIVPTGGENPVSGSTNNGGLDWN